MMKLCTSIYCCSYLNLYVFSQHNNQQPFKLILINMKRHFVLFATFLCATQAFGQQPIWLYETMPDSIVVGKPLTFRATFLGATRIIWKFDGKTTYEGTEITHQVEKEGQYAFSVTGYNGNLATTYRGTFQTTKFVHPCTIFICCSPCRISFLNEIYFDKYTTHLDETAKALLDENITVFKDCGKSFFIKIVGSYGNYERDPSLAKERAQAIEAYYLEKGIDGAYFSVNWETKPIMDIDSNAARKNRSHAFIVQSIPHDKTIEVQNRKN